MLEKATSQIQGTYKTTIIIITWLFLLEVCDLEVVSNFATFREHENSNIAVVKFDAISSLCSHGLWLFNLENWLIPFLSLMPVFTIFISSEKRAIRL